MGAPGGSDGHDPLRCSGHAHAPLTAADDDVVRREAATSNTTDLRRARQRARAVIRDIVAEIKAYIEEQPIRQLLSSGSGAGRANQALTLIAADAFRQELIPWLEERHRITVGRAVRDAFDKMTSTGEVDTSDLAGEPRFDRRLDAETLRQVRQVDAGLLYDTEIARERGLSEPLAQELGDDITRTLRQGVAADESVQELARRVDLVLTDGDADDRGAKGVTGQTKRSKAELIAHDSVQDAYNQAARGRYLRNGFRYGVYDATIDFKTTDLCRRMNEVVIDLRDSPILVPPLHPYCRSGIRPILNVDDRPIVGRDDVADDFLSTILSTKSYRPPANAAGDFQPTRITRELGQT